jgi:hypothetical protein
MMFGCGSNKSPTVLRTATFTRNTYGSRLAQPLWSGLREYFALSVTVRDFDWSLICHKRRLASLNSPCLRVNPLLSYPKDFACSVPTMS